VRLKSLFDRRPILVALAGPNGAGKSTFYEAHLARTGLQFVNADVFAVSLGLDAYKAAEMAAEIRRRFVAQRESFIFETVFSDPKGEKLNFLKDAERSGYTVVLIFIGISTPELSDMRVAMRVAKGGHDVPTEKLKKRFPRTMRNLNRALRELSNVLVFDHSDLDAVYRLAAEKLDGLPVALRGTPPEWLRLQLP
jgi:predicted ABC-type ATPase